jgi:SAM-dependent methyltransferase
MSSALQERIRTFWEANSCGAKEVPLELGRLEFFDAVAAWRYSGDDFMAKAVGFERANGRRVLEVGCGLGTDLAEFARNGARVTGVDLTVSSSKLASSNLGAHGYGGSVLVADARNLPFASDAYDFVYSWGVIHHTPDPAAAAREIIRVCRPGGRVVVMVYNRHSLFAAQAWIRFGLLRGSPWRSPSSLIAEKVESPGTRVFSPNEVAALFPGVRPERLGTFVTRWDLRLGRRRFLPAWLRTLVPAALGWFIVLDGVKE